jgi:hypothetical protein
LFQQYLDEEKEEFNETNVVDQSSETATKYNPKENGKGDV